MDKSLLSFIHRTSALGGLLVSLLLSPALHSASTEPGLFLLSHATLDQTRALLDHGDTALQPALARLKKEADDALKLRPGSVMDKAGIAASGNKHDYFSYGPYWWPDPTKPDGLPYIRRDGEINPDSKKGTDSHPFVRTCDAIETLSLAYFFTRQESYAQHAALLARIWFNDPATRMNPSLDYAQGIPGINNGRGIGIIEVRTLTNLTDSLVLLEPSPAWTANDRSAFRAWLSDYYHWLTTSHNGLDEQKELNNHGTWYDAQAACLALALGRKDDANKILSAGLQTRLSTQIEPNGAQPRELARTKSLEYSFFNLEALMNCASLGDHAGVDWWSFTTADGRSLHAALAYLAPYVDPAKPWPQKDLVNPGRERLLPLFAEYLAHHDDAQFRMLFDKFSPNEGTARWRLLLPTP